MVQLDLRMEERLGEMRDSVVVFTVMLGRLWLLVFRSTLVIVV